MGHHDEYLLKLFNIFGSNKKEMLWPYSAKNK